MRERRIQTILVLLTLIGSLALPDLSTVHEEKQKE